VIEMADKSCDCSKDGKCSFDAGPLAMALIVAAVLFSSAFYFAPSKATALLPSSEEQRRLISVSADSSQEIEPDKVEVSLSVVSRGADPAAIQEENDAKIRQIRSALIGLGVPEANIKTIGYSLDRWMEYNKTQEKYDDLGYQLSNSIRVVSYNVSNAGAIVKSSVQNGANDVSGIQFSLADATQKKLYGTLLQNAASTAKGKAEGMASAAGVKIEALSQMTEGYSYAPQPMANYDYRTMAMEAKAGGAVPSDVAISPGMMKVSASVSATYVVSG